MPISNSRVLDSEARPLESVNRESEIENTLKTPRRGQSAECPDRLITKKAAESSSNFWE